MAQEEDLSFLAFFLNEPVYLLPEEAPVFIPLPEEEAEVIAQADTMHDAGANEKEEKEEITSAPDVPGYEGQNRKAVLVLYHQPDSTQMPEGSKTFLQKILRAVAHEPDDVALCNWALLEQQASEVPGIYETLQSIDSSKILVFGDLPLSWSMSHFFQKYHITQDADGRQLLQADDLLMIAQNRDLKVKLWESLQRLFK